MVRILRPWSHRKLAKLVLHADLESQCFTYFPLVQVQVFMNSLTIGMCMQKLPELSLPKCLRLRPETILYGDLLLRLINLILVQLDSMDLSLYLALYNKHTSSIKMYKIDMPTFQVVVFGATYQVSYLSGNGPSDLCFSVPLSVSVCSSFIHLLPLLGQSLKPCGTWESSEQETPGRTHK